MYTQIKALFSLNIIEARGSYVACYQFTLFSVVSIHCYADKILFFLYIDCVVESDCMIRFPAEFSNENFDRS